MQLIKKIITDIINNNINKIYDGFNNGFADEHFDRWCKENLGTLRERDNDLDDYYSWFQEEISKYTIKRKMIIIIKHLIWSMKK